MLPALFQFEGLLDASAPRWDILVAGLALAVLYVGFRARTDIAEAMGFTQADVALVTVGGIAAQTLSVPLAVVDEAVLAVNLGGAIVPAMVIWRLARRGALSMWGVVLGAGVVAAVTFFVVELRPGQGVVAPFPQFLLPPAAALVVGLVAGRARPSRAGPHAFAAGSLGALVGADLLLLPGILDLASETPAGTALVIGGAGAFDLVFLSGAVGLALGLVLAAAVTRSPRERRLAPGAPLRIPEPEALVARANRLGALTPRERCLVHLAHANHALADEDGRRATLEAHKAVDALLRSGAPALLARLRRHPPTRELRDALQALHGLARAAHDAEPTWPDAVEAVEIAKRAAGGLWPEAVGAVRLEGVFS